MIDPSSDYQQALASNALPQRNLRKRPSNHMTQDKKPQSSIFQLKSQNPNPSPPPTNNNNNGFWTERKVTIVGMIDQPH